MADVNNIDILHALQALGVQLPSSVDTTGTQHGTFMKRLASLGIDKDQFTQAEKLAGWDGNPDSIGDIVGGSQHLDANAITNAYSNFRSIQTTGHPLPPPAAGPAVPAYGPLPPQATGQFGLAPSNPTNQPPGYTSHEGSAGLAMAGTPAPASTSPYLPGKGPAAPTPAPAAPKPTATAPAKAPAGSPGATTASTPGAGAQPAPDLTPKNDAEAIALLQKTYGKDAWMLNIPDLKAIVLGALKNPSGVSQSTIDSAIMKTPWWQQNGQHVADFLSAASTDPLSLNEKIHDKALQVQAKASASGLDVSYDRAVGIATDWQKWGWDDATLQGTIANEFHYQTGQHNTTVDQLQTLAHKYYTPISDGTIQQWGQKLIAGTDNINNFQEFLKNQARSMFPGAAPRLDGGETMEDIAKPYSTLAAQYLEINPQDFDPMKDPKWMAALDQTDPKTGVKTMMSNNEWIQKIRTDSSYGYNQTKQAKDAAVGFAMDIAKKFGATA